MATLLANSVYMKVIARPRVALTLISLLGLATLLGSTLYQYGGPVGNVAYYAKKIKSPSNADITLDDVFISVKTTRKSHSSRLHLILRTWWTTARNQAYIFTDIDDERLSNITGGHIINTKCGISYRKDDLCCKMGHEYDAFAESGKKWWCHVDDDNYVNVGVLLKVLREYDWKSKVYIGKKSIDHTKKAVYSQKERVQYWFLTGGAGVCISKGLRDGMDKWCRNGTFRATCKNIGEPDDTTLGFIVTNRLGVNVTERQEFNSHLQKLELIPNSQLTSQATLSYRLPSRKRVLNVISIDEKQALFNSTKDPTRFLSYHCLIYPHTDWCQTRRNV